MGSIRPQLFYLLDYITENFPYPIVYKYKQEVVFEHLQLTVAKSCTTSEIYTTWRYVLPFPFLFTFFPIAYQKIFSWRNVIIQQIKTMALYGADCCAPYKLTFNKTPDILPVLDFTLYNHPRLATRYVHDAVSVSDIEVITIRYTRLRTICFNDVQLPWFTLSMDSLQWNDTQLSLHSHILMSRLVVKY